MEYSLQNSLLEVKHLKKQFKENMVLNDISFTLQPGEILCFLGPNGAGKSTTIHILTAALQKDGGEILFHRKKIEKTLRAYKQCLGIVPQDLALYEDLSAEQNLRFFAALYGLHGKELEQAVSYALSFAGLSDRSHDKVSTFSGGMKRRLNIACAIAHRPELVIMDEPTVGIDPQSRNYILDSIRKLREEGMTILYTTHYMEEVEAISTRILIMDHGKIIAEGTKESLKEDIENEKRYLIEAEENEDIPLKEFYAIEGVKAVEQIENSLSITSLKSVENLDRIISLFSTYHKKIKNITTENASLETVFLKLTGRKLRD